ncbi:hypothetical protein MHY87_08375 [Microvirga sp. ACRRW]|uniref:hypothetical protein n=1 Tax=Microvirga sp. ACRRW TaxID=2918205 RepID=UPI001EF694BB|nr:hypothetical protein [Microvirga sp. ACRRW]MCG7392916.1 hypothetical protein [Microvirga sp. ACRRW]
MKSWPAITRLLSIFAIATFVFASFAASAEARGMIAFVAATDAGLARTSASYDGAPAEVPCCMPAQPSMPESPKACPLAALCHVKVVQDVSVTSAGLRWSSPAHAPVPGNDAALETLAQAPPSRPPQA